MDFVCSSWNPYYDPGPTQKLVQKVVAQRTTTGAMSIDVFHHLVSFETIPITTAAQTHPEQRRKEDG